MSKTQREMVEEMYKVEPDIHVTNDGRVFENYADHNEAYEKAISVLSIHEDRQSDYGDAKVSHTSIANFWNEYLERKMSCGVFDGLDATDVAVMLSLMKVSRLAYSRKHDSFLDFASYADFALQFESEE
jgi:hypothetical protein